MSSKIVLKCPVRFELIWNERVWFDVYNSPEKEQNTPLKHQDNNNNLLAANTPSKLISHMVVSSKFIEIVTTYTFLTVYKVRATEELLYCSLQCDFKTKTWGNENIFRQK